ncbi:MAG TPA: TlpA disulfide reductase family protein [Pyrinomonadaceae bacterium]|nr:TlpA disulfide reductase family protein [Pyrinomonadaceae bacterium]
MTFRSACKLLLAVTAIMFVLATSARAQSPEKLPGRTPTFKLLDLNGRLNDLAELRGNVVLVSFGATWCAPCSTELRALEEVFKEYSGKPVKFFWVSVESPEQVTNANLKRYARQRNVSFPVLRDSSQAVFLQFSPRVRLPMIVMLGMDGRVAQPVEFGMRSPLDAYKADIRARLDRLLAEPSDSER